MGRVALSLLCLLLSAPGAYSQDSTASALGGQSIGGRLRIRLASVRLKEATGAAFEFAQLPQDVYDPLPTGKTFSAPGSVKILYPRLNPFELQVTASQALADDPSNAALAKFVEAALAFPKTIGANQSSARDACPSLVELSNAVNTLAANLRAGASAEQNVVNWRKAVADTPGPGGIRDAIAAIRKYAETLRNAMTNARAAFETVKRISGVETFAISTDSTGGENAGTGSSGAGTSSNSGTSTTPRSVIAPSQPPATGSAQRGAGDQAPQQPETQRQPQQQQPQQPQQQQPPQQQLEPRAVAAACDPIELVRRAIATGVVIGDTQLGLERLQGLADTVSAVATSLEAFASDGDWEGTDYVVFVTTATPEKFSTVTLRAAPLTYAVEGGVIARSVLEKRAESVSFVIRRHSTFVAEIGAGLVVSGIRKPQYGTETLADGRTVVARTDTNEVSYSAAVMLNTVCRCTWESALYPMLQFGVAANADAPGLLFGGGFRFVRPKPLSFSGGVVVAWVKDLDDLAVGAPVSGTAAILEDLTPHVRVKPYFSIQYNF